MSSSSAFCAKSAEVEENDANLDFTGDLTCSDGAFQLDEDESYVSDL